VEKTNITQEILDSISIVSVCTYIDEEDFIVLALECETKAQADNLFSLANSNFFIFNPGIDISEKAFLELSFIDAKLKKTIYLPGREIIDLFQADKIKYLTTGSIGLENKSDFFDTVIILERTNYGKLN